MLRQLPDSLTPQLVHYVGWFPEPHVVLIILRQISAGITWFKEELWRAVKLRVEAEVFLLSVRHSPSVTDQ